MKVRKNIEALKPYICARYTQVQGILMDANEMPFGEWNRYPDPLASRLRKRLAEYVGCSPENICVTNGSDEAIDLLVRIFCEPGKGSITVREPTYGMYRVVADINDVKVDDNGEVVFLCSPNNPTGELIDDDIVEEYLKRDCVVVIDEAYFEFAGKTWADKIDEYENLVVLRTMSKAWGAAGIRLGYVVASQCVIDLLQKVKPPYNVNALSQQKALEILSKEGEMRRNVELILSERERVKEELENFGFNVYPSEANFLLFEATAGTYEKLLDGGIVIRDRSKDIPNTLRVSIGSPEQNNKFLSILKS